MHRIAPALAAIVILFPADDALCQRYEVGRRLVEFDNAWEKHRDSPRKKEATSQLLPVVPNFFAARWGAAAKRLDQARHTLISDKKPADSVRWADALHWQFNTRLIERSKGKLVATLSPFYEVELATPKNALLKLTLSNGDKPLKGPAQTAIGKTPVTTTLDLKGLPEGDHTLIAEVCVGGQCITREQHLISIVQNPAERIASVRKGWQSLPASVSATEKETVLYLSQLLNALADGKSLEIGYPSFRLLNQIEAAVQTLNKKQTYYGGKRDGQYWLKLATKKDSYVSRLFAPGEVKRAKPLPLVVALHGLGGSENLFFESYGNGYIVDQCKKRGWLLVSPRSPYLKFRLPVAELIDEVAKLYPVDRKRIFVVGHSMGAAQAVAAAQEDPDLFAGVAALGGSGGVKAAKDIKHIPFFVGAGERDFALESAKLLATTLKSAGVKSVEFREYANVEHIMVVREALPDVFAMFDKAAK